MNDKTKQGSDLKASDVLDAFGPAFLDEQACREWIIARLYPGGVACPRCGELLQGARLQAVLSGRRSVCSECGKQFGPTTNTVFSGMTYDFKKLVFLLYLIGSGCSTNEIISRTGASRSTINRYKKLFL